ncbi:hypothetical protein SCLCIDRAFT_29033 [Scleroderma citrinum Foug A]|uniref:Uncharacterized protein n=1 Tax=Scleroderma citrinum Foug A TaxID=1036808 RepID=A0A0C3DLS8_9AGAM|nr:hypothetical protein SCLCIDRAFT_29033 [Scleroderma citrinum Foug A]
MSCEPAPGNYNILSYIDSNAVNTCPSLAPAEVVILNDVTPITLTAFNGPPDCTYLIQVHGGYVKSQAIPNTLQTIDDGNAVTWIFKLSRGPYMTCIKAFNSMTTLQPDGLTQEVNLVVIVKYDPVFITYGMAQL